MKIHSYYVYILTNPANTSLYIGVTNNLQQRLYEHYMNRGDERSYAGKYHCYNLLYYEQYKYVDKAIARDKELKGWVRNKKLELIKTENPELKFLNEQVCTKWPPGEDAFLRDNM